MVPIFSKNKIIQKLGKAIHKKEEPSGEVVGEGAIPILTPDMITPVDKPVSTKRAVQVYKEFMLKVGYLDKSDLDDFARSLKEDMAEREEELKFDIQSAKELVAEARAEVKQRTKEHAKCKDDDDREYAKEELDAAQAELDEETAAHDLLVRKLNYLKKDKRGFLLNYINSEIHGDDWAE